MTLVTPIIRLPNSQFTTPNAQIPLSSLAEISDTLIPSLSLAGVLFTPPISTADEQFIRKTVRSKNPIIKPLSSKPELNPIDLNSIIKVEGKANLDLRFSYDNNEDVNKVLQKQIQKNRQAVVLAGKKLWGYTKDSIIGEVEANTLNLEFIVPNIKMKQCLTVEKTTAFKGVVPIAFLMHADSLTAAEAIDVFTKELSTVLRTMIRNDLPYRSIENRIPGIITENYSEVPIIPIIQKTKTEAKQPQPNRSNEKPAPIGLIVAVLIGCLILYIGIKFI